MASYPTSVKSFAARSAGQTIASAHMNDVQDEINAIEAGLLQGSAPLNSSNSTVASLSVAGGSTLAGPVVCSTVVTAAAQPRCHLSSTAVQAISSATTYTGLTFETEDIDVGGLHSTASNSSRVVIPSGSSGLYWLNGLGLLNTLGQPIQFQWLKGATVVAQGQYVSNSSNGGTFQLAAIAQCDAGDTLTFAVRSPVGSTLSVGVSGNEAFTRLMVAKLW